uniref:Uncharacterized protein n=1 Tax=Oryza sativa subsp. japonica TaxID=39947 RepID=Q75L69_ORYSJ|nr:hypothetical protein [Oryza sativa Japonica Group]
MRMRGVRGAATRGGGGGERGRVMGGDWRVAWAVWVASDKSTSGAGGYRRRMGQRRLPGLELVTAEEMARTTAGGVEQGIGYGVAELAAEAGGRARGGRRGGVGRVGDGGRSHGGWRGGAEWSGVGRTGDEAGGRGG